MIGPKLHDHTALVLNKVWDALKRTFPERLLEIRKYWKDLIEKNAVTPENGCPRGDPRPIVELIWDKSPENFALSEELIISRKKLCKTTVGKVYQKLLEKEIKRSKGEPARSDALKEELKQWKKSADTYHSLLQ